MNLQEYILNEIKGIPKSDSLKSAKNLCKKLPISHVPIVENRVLHGCISECDLQTLDNSSDVIKNNSHLLDFFYVHQKDSLLDVLSAFANNDCNILPVLDENQNYLGYYELSDILDIFTHSPFLYNNSIELVIEKLKKDYSASQICQIAESSNAQVLGLYVSQEDSEKVEITLKITTDDINEIIQTFRRYNYKIISNHQDDVYLQDIQDRAEYLKKYLDI